MGSDQDQRDKKTAGAAVGAGENLGHYKLISQLGAGGMGEVWEAEDSKLDRRVALKVLPSELAESPERIERFEREAKALAALDHPNIVTIHSVEQSEGVHYLTMGLVSGRTLGELIPDGGMALDGLLELAVPLAGAVAAAHEKGITHRDLKPSNVMVTDDGVVKVLDFGLAKVADSDAITPGLATEMPTEGLTVEGTVLGTTSYMSPEQVEGKPIDHRSDIFSLGVVLYEMATGIRPFQGDTSAGVMSSILKDQPQPLPEARDDLPRQLGRIIGQCLEKDPPDRFQTARDVHNGMKNLRREVSSDTSWVSSVHAPTEEGPSKGTRRWVLVTVVLAITLVLIWVGFVDDEQADDGLGDDVATEVRTANPAVVAPDAPPMIAVLPFENLGAPEDEYFAAGMTEEITTRLASLSEIGVIASTSARQYVSTDKSAPQIGEELGADYLVLGSVRWAQDPDGSSRLRISPKLISTADDVQVWADSYDRVFEDVFGIQSDIATKVVEHLNVTLGESEQAGLEDRPTANMVAYDYYLQARAVPGHFSNEEAIRERIELANRAVELDPDFAQGWVWLALYESNLYGYGYDKSEGQHQLARETIERAVELNMNSPARVHRLYAHYYFQVERDYERAIEENALAVELEPNNGVARAGIGYSLRRMGRFEEALVELEKAQRLDPRSTNILAQLGSIHTFLGNFEEALAYYDKVTAIDSTTADVYRKKANAYLRWTGDVVAARRALNASPADARPDSNDLAVQFSLLVFEERFEEAIAFLDSLSVEAIGLSTHYRPRSLLAGFTYQLLGDPASAQEAFEKAAAHLEREVEAQPDHVKRVASLGIAYAALGRNEEAIQLGLQAADMVPLEREGYFGLTEVLDLAWIYTLVGEYDLAFDQLEILLSRPSWITIPLLKLEPRWSALVDQPRFAELEEKYG